MSNTQQAGPTVLDSLEAIRVAAALGMEVPAPEGTHAYLVTITHRSGYKSQLGVYSSPQEADNALADYIVWEWLNREYLPGSALQIEYDNASAYRRDLSAWIQGKTPEDVIAAWNQENHGTKISSATTKLLVEGHPVFNAGGLTSRLGKKHYQ